jgi:predicted polyphosphate/ATP-dependent NAD kinase
MFKLGLIINPFAGIGGRVGLKGSDGNDIRQQALALGGLKLAESKTQIALSELNALAQDMKNSLVIYTVSGEMGESVCEKLGLAYQVCYQANNPSTEQDTQFAVAQMIEQKVDLILFAGGDGTARNILQACVQYNADEEQTVLGIPAGVKIHSAVYAITPQAAGWLVRDLVKGKILSLHSADIMDIDESAFRQGVVKAKRYGYLNVPAALEYVQSVKSGGQEVEALVLDDIADEVIESMQDDTYYVIGSGTTCAAVMRRLDLGNTLLGSDIVFQSQLFKADAIEKDLLSLIESGKKLKFILTTIGGQGHILGRGNHQISPEVIKQVGWQQFEIIATKAKLETLNGRPLLTDTGDVALDKQLAGSKKVITGYRDYVIYPVGFTPQ